jgi:hypothetical protein
MFAVLALGACGDSSEEVVGDGDGGIGPIDFSDADPSTPDAGPNQGCNMTSGPQCNNCVDDDGDTLIDGFDPECTGPLDDREDSFATGIPGDNIDKKKQDCFFDGNSGGGDDKCAYSTCCLFPEGTECPAEFGGPDFDESECVVSQECINNCAPLTPVGCDCFGCCTICNDVGCFDVATNPIVSPDCTADVADDPTKCAPCVKSEQCGGDDCTEFECVLCPGQTEEDLPPECGGENECENDYTPCDTSDDCNIGESCLTNCCIPQID